MARRILRENEQQNKKTLLHVKHYMFHPVLPIRRKSATLLARSKSSLERSPYEVNLRNIKSATRPQSVKYDHLNVRCDFVANTDVQLNAKIHEIHLNNMTDQNQLTKSKLADLKKEYYDRRTYNTVVGCNKKNFKKQHSLRNVYSVVSSKGLDVEPLSLFEMDDKYFVETQIHPLVKSQRPVIKTCSHLYFNPATRMCLECKRYVDRMSYKKRVFAKTHFYSNDKSELESELTLKSADPKYEIMLPVNFFKTMNSMSSRADSFKQNSDSIKNQSKSTIMTDYENCEFDFEIKPDLTLWNVA